MTDKIYAELTNPTVSFGVDDAWDLDTMRDFAHQNKLLADALAACIVASGIVRKDVDGFTLPQLLHFAKDLHEAAPKAALGEQESAYQRGYMDGMAKGRRDAEAAPQPVVREPLTDEQAQEILKNSELLDMFLRIGWYSAPQRHFVTNTLALIRTIEAVHGITQNGGNNADT